MLNFTVYGVPQPQGSIRAFTPKGWKRPVLTSDNAKVKPWRQEIAGTALAIMERDSIRRIERPAGVKVTAYFYFPRPKSTKKSVEHKTTKPDIDKLTRALHDALTGIAFEDDSQIVESKAVKSSSAILTSRWIRYKNDGSGPLQRVTVTEATWNLKLLN
jgi:crossover junction endodeoxyribonuclease RusA